MGMELIMEAQRMKDEVVREDDAIMVMMGLKEHEVMSMSIGMIFATPWPITRVFVA